MNGRATAISSATSWWLRSLLKISMPYGMIPELIGRLPVIATLNQLSEADLARILTEPKDALSKQYEVLFHYDGAKLEYTHGAIREIARRAKCAQHLCPGPPLGHGKLDAGHHV